MSFLAKGKTNWKFIAILLVLALLVSGGILGYLRNVEKEMESPVKFSETKKPEEVVKNKTAKPVPSGVEEWKTYRNEKYGFEIKYPNFISPSSTASSAYLMGNGWSSRARQGSKGALIASFVICQFSGIPSAESYHSFVSELRIGASSDPKEVENCLSFENTIPEDTDINGTKFKKFRTSDAASGHRANFEVYRTVHNDICFSIEKLEHGYLYNELEYPRSPHYNFEYSQKFNSCRETTTQMLSTFRFLEGKTSEEKPYIQVLSPNGGEKWEIGKQYEIKWKSEGIDANLPVGITLIDYSQNKEYGIDTGLAKIGDGKLTTSWGAAFPISVPSGNKYKIRVYVATKEITAQYPDESDNYFSIVAPTISSVLYKTEWDGGRLTTSLLRSEDGGKTWKVIRTQYKGGITYTTDSKNPKIIYAGDTGGNMMAENLDIDLVKSYDGGDSWIDISKGVISKDCSVCSQKIAGTDKELSGIDSIWVDPSNSNIVKVTVSSFGSEKITFKSTNGGLSWARETAVNPISKSSRPMAGRSGRLGRVTKSKFTVTFLPRLTFG